MFKHIVMWRFIDGANGKSKKEHALWVKENLEALVGVVPEIRTLGFARRKALSKAAPCHFRQCIQPG